MAEEKDAGQYYSEEELGLSPFQNFARPPKTPEYTPGQRLARLGLLKGPSFGLLGRDVQAETIPEHIAEFAGSIPTVAGTTALLSPVAGAAGLTGIGARLGTAGLVGGAIGTAESIAQGDITQIPKEAALNVAAEAAFIGGGRLLRKLRPAAKVLPEATPQQTKLAALTKATTTQVPDTPPSPKAGVSGNQLNIPTIEPQGELFPPSAGFGPKIDADSKSLMGNTAKPHGRVTLDEYVQLADEYGQPIQISPETRFGVPGATQLDEFGLPVPSRQQVGPEELARVTSPAAPGASLSNLPNWVRTDIEQKVAMADRYGISDKIEELAAQRLTAGEIAQQLKGIVPPDVDTVSLVKAVRAQRGIPSMDTGTEFEQWAMSKLYQSQPSRELGTQVIVPLTKEADDVVKVLMDAPFPRQTEMQFGPDQIEFFSRAEGQGLKNRLNNVVPQRDAVKTSEVVKLPEADVEKIVNSETPVKVIESVVLNKTKDGKHVEFLGAKNNHSAADLSQMAREAEEIVATMGLKGESKRLAFKLQMARIMKERCL